MFLFSRAIPLLVKNPDTRSWTPAWHFPPVSYCDEHGIIAFAGNLSTAQLTEAYSRGIFPWPWDETPMIPWFCPKQRFILPVDQLHVPKSLRRVMKKHPYRLSMDTAFPEVIRHCSLVERHGQNGTWITERMIRAYTAMYELHLAHSVEAWLDERLVGGLYGISLGDVFFGESMFALEPDASKIAFVSMVNEISSWGIKLIDCQDYTDHLARFGAGMCDRDEFLIMLDELLKSETRQYPWRFTGAE